jgi:uncharacterized protein YjbI with pentapeptide repeats/uncharacterized protein
MSFLLFAAATAATVAPNSGAAGTLLPANSCQTKAGLLNGQGADLPLTSYQGSSITSARKFNSLIRKLPYGETVIIEGGDFTGWKFGLKWRLGARRLSNICFVGTKLAQTDWTDGFTSGIGFIDVDLTGAKMNDVEMPFVLFRNATLQDVSAREADWSFGKLDGGWSSSMANLQIEEADLTGFRFVCGASQTDGCSFDRKGINARRANLTNASIKGFYVNDTDFTQARIDGIEMGVDQLEQFKGSVALAPVRINGGPFTQIASAQEYNALRTTLNAPVQADTRCVDPSDPLQMALCADPSKQLIDLDTDIALLTPGKSMPKNRTKAFSKNRQKCLKKKEAGEKNACLTTAYESWRTELISSAQPPIWAQQPGKLLFARSDLPINRDAVSSALWSRFGAVVAGSAPSYMAVSVDSPGRISVRGKSTAIDGSQCQFNLTGLKYENGYFGMQAVPLAVTVDPRKKPKKQKKQKTQPLTPFAFFLGEEAQLTPNQNRQMVFVDGGIDTSQLVQCTGPAPFGKMQMLQVDNGAFDIIWQGSLGLPLRL